jgi:hypothetical protein
MQLAHVEIYVASAGRLTLLRRLPVISALVMAGLGALTLASAVDVNALGARSIAYLVVWTALGTAIMLYAFLGTVGPIWGKAADLDKLNTTT